MNTLNATVNIKVEHLHEHPDNPRKDLGDLKEMVDSVKKNGIMQNLTVMPVSAINDDPEMQLPANRIPLESEFIVLIGHRRLVAAKQAGLEKLPCRIVSQISKKEQVGIMLEENMQRNDLTIWEQAQGFQMMLDLGSTEEQIAEKTGFSRTTVRHRLNIAKLDQERLKEVEDEESGFQLTLRDLYELEAIEDIKTRNEILAKASNSRDLVWRAHAAAKEEKRKKVEETITGMLKELGIEKAPGKAENIIYNGNYEGIKSYDLDAKAPEAVDIEAPDGLCYIRWAGELRVLRKKEELGKTTDALGMKEQMLLLLSNGMDDKRTIEYAGRFDAEEAEKLSCGYDVLKEYGWTFEQGEEELLDGTSELYVKKEKE